MRNDIVSVFEKAQIVHLELQKSGVRKYMNISAPVSDVHHNYYCGLIHSATLNAHSRWKRNIFPGL